MAAATQINIPRDRNMCLFIFRAIHYRIAPGRFARSSARSRSTGSRFNDRPENVCFLISYADKEYLNALDKSGHISYHVIIIILKFHRINVSGCCEKLVNFHVIGHPHVPEKSHPQYQKQIFNCNLSDE